MAYNYIVGLGKERRDNITDDGFYLRLTLSRVELNEVFKIIHPSATIDMILAHFKAKMLMTADTAHVYFSLPHVGEGPEPSEEMTLGWHSDAVSAVLIQVYGEKDLEIGGTHLTPAGSAGESVPLDEVPAGSFVVKKRLEPNSIVGLGGRQIHRLVPCSSPNMTIAIKIKAL
jgi:hypothetical protein